MRRAMSSRPMLVRRSITSKFAAADVLVPLDLLHQLCVEGEQWLHHGDDLILGEALLR